MIKELLKIFQKSCENNYAGISITKKLQGKKIWRSCFPINFAVFKSTYTIEHWRTVASVQITQFVIFKPLSYYFEEIIGFHSNASIASRPPSRLIKPGDITKEF